MLFTLFIPYQSSNFIDNKQMEGYYKSEDDYINALRAEEAANGSVIFNAMASGAFDSSTYYGGFEEKRNITHNIVENITYAKADCTLYSPNGAIPESVDSMIDKFAEQKEFLVTINFNMASMDGEFEEELREWNTETYNILKYRQKMGNEWVDKNIPRRDLRLSFLNKSGKLVKFVLEGSEIEEKITNNRYLLYVKKMSILK